MSYQDYIDSDMWKQQAIERKAEVKHCQLCGKRFSKLQVHHNSYRNVQNEQYFDLIVLCSDCHFWFHQTHKYDNKKHYFYRVK